eukprot:10434066-Alexandrium_andersonii.AAC.1
MASTCPSRRGSSTRGRCRSSIGGRCSTGSMWTTTAQLGWSDSPLPEGLSVSRRMPLASASGCKPTA